MYSNINLFSTIYARHKIINGYDKPIKVENFPIEVYVTPKSYTVNEFAKDKGYTIDKMKKKGFKDYAEKDGKTYSIILDFDEDVNYYYIRRTD